MIFLKIENFNLFIYFPIIEREAIMSRQAEKKKIANKVFDVLKEHIGVCESERDSFVFHFGTTEYRIGGKLGFGGKFWVNNDQFYVSCYSEDQTPKRRLLIEKVNKLLAGIYKPSLAERR